MIIYIVVLIDSEQRNTCWESAAYFTIALIKQALIVHRILYSFCEICKITKWKSTRKGCIEFYLSIRRPPIFPINLRNMFHRTDAELPRTNNSIERWHRSLMRRFSLTTQHFGYSWTILREKSRFALFRRSCTTTTASAICW